MSEHIHWQDQLLIKQTPPISMQEVELQVAGKRLMAICPHTSLPRMKEKLQKHGCKRYSEATQDPSSWHMALTVNFIAFGKGQNLQAGDSMIVDRIDLKWLTFFFFQLFASHRNVCFDKVSLYNLGWSDTHYVDQVDLVVIALIQYWDYRCTFARLGIQYFFPSANKAEGFTVKHTFPPQYVSILSALVPRIFSNISIISTYCFALQCWE